MIFLAINSGSSSLKAKVIEMPSRQILFEFEAKNYSDIEFVLTSKGEGIVKESAAISSIDWENRAELLLEKVKTKLSHTSIDFYIHRIVHGGERFREPILLTRDTVFELSETFNKIAPLHNPQALDIVDKIFESNIYSKQIGVFDTSWNLSIPAINYLYAIPENYYKKLRVRRYGFHGISHKYVYNTLMEYKVQKSLNHNNNLKVLSCHLGSGCSVAAIKNGKVVDNSFGFSPMENIIMATRVGEIDYDAVKYIQKEENLSDNEVSDLLTKKSGLLGVSGYTKDMKKLLNDRDIVPSARLAIDLFVNSVIKTIGSMYITLGGLDLIIFTGGIGTGSDYIRDLIVKKIAVLGGEIDSHINNGRLDVDEILNLTGENSRFEIWAVPTNEELQLCIDSFEYINNNKHELL